MPSYHYYIAGDVDTNPNWSSDIEAMGIVPGKRIPATLDNTHAMYVNLGESKGLNNQYMWGFEVSEENAIAAVKTCQLHDVEVYRFTDKEWAHFQINVIYTVDLHAQKRASRRHDHSVQAAFDKMSAYFFGLDMHNKVV